MYICSWQLKYFVFILRLGLFGMVVLIWMESPRFLEFFRIYFGVQRQASEKVFCIYLKFGSVWHGHSYVNGITQIFGIFWDFFWCAKKSV